MERMLGRSLHRRTGGSPPGSPEQRAYLREYAEELYWNELEWESLTGEEVLDRGHFTELAFPGFLAFVRGLLLEEVMPDSKAPAEPRPEVVEDTLTFLAGRVVELEEELAQGPPAEPEKSRLALTLTNRLINVVMTHLYEVSAEELEELERELEAG
jgi:hypothetical protein